MLRHPGATSTIYASELLTDSRLQFDQRQDADHTSAAEDPFAHSPPSQDLETLPASPSSAHEGGLMHMHDAELRPEEQLIDTMRDGHQVGRCDCCFVVLVDRPLRG